MKIFFLHETHRLVRLIKVFILMKLIIVLLVTLLLQQGQAAIAQYIDVSKNNVPLREVLKEIRVQSGYDFFFDEASLKTSRPVSIHIKNGTVEEVLKAAFQNQPLTYSIVEKTIVVKNRLNTNLSVSTDRWLQQTPQQTLAGKVTDAKNEPLIGVSITIKGTNQGTSTDTDGSFQIPVKSGDVLVFTYVGFASQEITIGNQTSLQVTLKEDNATMEEVVVTALGISREKKSLGYSSQAVSGEDINTVNTGNVTDALSGKVSGVQIKRSSNMGGSTNIVIRGNKSLTGNNQALWVVDGIPVDNSNLNTEEQATGGGGAYDYGNMASDINQDDIESINVLKGAAATALYGSRAANGAIIITTKSGAKGEKVNITLNSSVKRGTIDRSTFPVYQQQYGAGLGAIYGPDGESYFNYQDFDGDGILDEMVPYVAYGSFGAPYDPNRMVFDWHSLDPASPTYMQKTPWVPAKNGPITFFEKPLTFNNNLSIAGSGPTANYRFSYTNMNQSGLMPNSKSKRDNFSLNASFKINDRLTVSGHGNYVYSDVIGRNMTGGVGNGGNNVLGTFRQWWQNHVDVQQLKRMYFDTRRNITNYAGGTIDNVYWQQYEIYSTDNRNRFFGNMAVNYKITDWLNVDGRISVDTYSFMREERVNNGSIAIGKYDRLNVNFREVNYDLMLNFNKDITDKFNISGVLGTNIRRNLLESINAVTNGGLVVDDIYSISNSVLQPAAPIESLVKIGVDGYYGLLSFGYNNMLYLDVTGRNDRSSTLPANNNSYFYPSIATSFVFSEVIESEVLSFGKLRLNYAKVGNSAPAHSIVDVLNKPTPFGSHQMYGVNDVKNNDQLKPESTTSLEAGVEAQFLGRRLGLDISWYKTNTEDQIMPVSVSSTTGYTSKFVNAGEVQNKGIELSLTGTPIRNDNFSWDVNVNWSRNRSKILSLFEGVENLVLGSRINATLGQPYGTITGRNFVFIDGQPVINQTTGEYMLSQASNHVIGNINPDWIGGVRNQFRYKNFNASFLIDVQKGGQLFSSDMSTGNRNGLYDNLVGLNDLGNPMRNSLEDGGGIILDGVDPDGNKNTVRTRMDRYDHALGAIKAPDALFIYDASYVKLREVVLSYALPSELLKNSKIEGISFNLTGSNLWIIHKNLPYADPEAGLSSGNVQGIQTGVLPTIREFAFGVKVQF